MRRKLFYLSVALLVFGIGSPFLSSCVSAQEKTEKITNEKVSNENAIEESKFEELISKTLENIKGKTYRLTETIEYFPDRNASVESVTTKILEVVVPNKKREIEEIKSPATNSRRERIWDGKALYEKQNDGEWRKYTGGGNGSSGDSTSGRTTTVYKFIRKETLDSKTADVYESESHRVANKMTRTSQYRVEYVTKTKYWISEDGLLLKTTKDSEVVGSKALSREKAIYEYDSNIKIEAPIK